MARKDLLLDLLADPGRRIVITTSAGRSYTAYARGLRSHDLEICPPVERLELDLGSIEPVDPVAPSRASIEQLLLDAYPALALAPPRLRAHLERHAGAIAQLVDAAGEGEEVASV